MVRAETSQNLVHYRFNLLLYLRYSLIPSHLHESVPNSHEKLATTRIFGMFYHKKRHIFPFQGVTNIFIGLRPAAYAPFPTPYPGSALVATSAATAKDHSRGSQDSEFQVLTPPQRKTPPSTQKSLYFWEYEAIAGQSVESNTRQ